MKVRNMTSPVSGGAVANQFIVYGDDGSETFQSYRTVIAINRAGHIQLDRNSWDYSVTTGRYRNQFLGETKKETLAKINNGTYELVDLNK